MVFQIFLNIWTNYNLFNSFKKKPEKEKEKNLFKILIIYKKMREKKKVQKGMRLFVSLLSLFFSLTIMNNNNVLCYFKNSLM